MVQVECFTGFESHLIVAGLYALKAQLLEQGRGQSEITATCPYWIKGIDKLIKQLTIEE